MTTYMAHMARQAQEKETAELQALRLELAKVRAQRNGLAGRATHGDFCPGPVGLPCSCALNSILQEIAKEQEAKA